LVTSRFEDNPAASPEEIVELWEKIIHPSHEILENMIDDEKIVRGYFAAQR
jgi:hypothetical protein